MIGKICLWTSISECVEECGDIEEVETAVTSEVRDWIHCCKCIEERGNIEEVEYAVIGEICQAFIGTSAVGCAWGCGIEEDPCVSAVA